MRTTRPRNATKTLRHSWLHKAAVSLALISHLAAYTAAAQTAEPPIPVIDSVTVTTQNQILLAWRLEQPTDINDFVVYRRTPGAAAFIAFDTLRGVTPPFSVIDAQAAPDQHPAEYSVASMAASDTLSGLARPHAVVMAKIADYDACGPTAALAWTAYQGAEEVSYTVICQVDNNYFTQVDAGTAIIADAPAVAGTKNRYAIRSRWKSGSSTSAFVELDASELEIERTTSIASLAAQPAGGFAVTTRNRPSPDRDSALLLAFDIDGNPIGRYSVEAAQNNEHAFVTPPLPATTHFKPGVTDRCGNSYTNNLAVSGIHCETRDMAQYVAVSWNRPRGVDNMTYEVLENGNSRGLAYGDTLYQRNLTGELIEGGELRFQIIATNDTLRIESNVATIEIDDNLLWPNAFSPNGDGLNDGFGAVAKRLEPSDFELVVYNKQGMAIFRTTNRADRWDGTYRGRPQPRGGYVWRAKYTIGGENIEKQGVVTIVY